jgi:hypothetical protein
MAIDHEATVQAQTVVVNVVGVTLNHAVAELLLADDLAEVLHEELPRCDRPRGPHAPPYAKKRAVIQWLRLKLEKYFEICDVHKNGAKERKSIDWINWLFDIP